MKKIDFKNQKNVEKKLEKIGKNQKKLKKIIWKNNWKIINYTCIYVYMKYWQYLIIVGRIRKKKKKIEKYFISSCLRELKQQKQSCPAHRTQFTAISFWHPQHKKAICPTRYWLLLYRVCLSVRPKPLFWFQSDTET